MTMMTKSLQNPKTMLKELLGVLPLTAELYAMLRRPRAMEARFDLARLNQALPGWRTQAQECLAGEPATERLDGRHVLIFGTLRYWIEHVTMVGLALAGQGAQVTLGYLPYASWQTPLNRFDLRRQDVYARQVLSQAEPLLKLVSFTAGKNQSKLPAKLAEAIQANARRDTQYTLQVEAISTESALCQLRLERDTAAASTALAWLQANRPDVVLIPNGTILEFGALYQTARYLGIPTVTYEFGEQRQRLWLAQDAEVMRQDTDALWQTYHDKPLSAAQTEQVRTLFAARQRASLWENFARRWQGTPSEGGEKVRQTLGLDQRPIVLLATNVIGDSLTLGRQVFSDSMTEWLERTVRYFAGRPDVQFVVRIHPGELITKGPSVADVVQHVLPELPAHIHLIPAEAKVNTYDIVEIADVGLVYTTTVGLEMAMSGTPVIVIGRTHYRNKGFTLDPDTWENYFGLLDQVLAEPARYHLERAQVEQAWAYAYRFFFDYPRPFPWHVVHFWDDVAEWPLRRTLSAEGQAAFGSTFRYLVGEKVVW
jgi:hypothetical protein